MNDLKKSRSLSPLGKNCSKLKENFSWNKKNKLTIDKTPKIEREIALGLNFILCCGLILILEFRRKTI
jgi:hypothetical protein